MFFRYKNIVRQKHLNFLKKVLKKAKDIPRKSQNFDELKTIGILFDAKDFNTRELVAKYAKSFTKKGKKVKLLGFYDEKNKGNEFDFKCFNKNDLNWHQIPDHEEVSKFMETPFDLLIDIHLGEILPLEYISALSKAKFRIGRYTPREECYDLMIDTQDNMDLDFFIGQVNFFINILNPKTNEKLAAV